MIQVEKMIIMEKEEEGDFDEALFMSKTKQNKKKKTNKQTNKQTNCNQKDRKCFFDTSELP